MLGRSFEAALRSATDGSLEDIMDVGAIDGECDSVGEGGEVAG